MSMASDSEVSPDQLEEQCDVLVIGGGPAGTTIATLLVERGHRVVVLEKEHYPRFHLGESLLPANMPLLRRLGVGDELEQIGTFKAGAEFVSPHHAHTQFFDFAYSWNKALPSAYQVKRAEFDQMLLNNAARKGAKVYEGARATRVRFGDDDSIEVDVRHDDGTTRCWRPRFLVDASGRDTFLGKHFDIKERNPHHTSAAVYTHYRGALRLDGHHQGNITIFGFEHGWFWFIPMRGDITSVGMVTWPYHMKSRAGRSLEQFFLDNVATVPVLAERVKNAERVRPVEGTGNFSYSSRFNHGKNFIMLGDAYAFIDPFFSSGVWLAMHSAVMGTDAVDAYLRAPEQAPAAMRRFDRSVQHGTRQFSWFIYRMNNPIMWDFFMGPRNILRMEEAVLSMLAGDIFEDTPIWRSLALFKATYYGANIIQPRRAFKAWRRRRRNIRTTDAVAPRKT